jgi:drug/metabolite transporter (DMT)-like permease
VSLLAATGVTAYTICSTVAIALAGPALPSLVLALSPAVVLIAEAALTRTRPPVRTLAGTLVAVAGALLYVIPRLAGTLGNEVALGAVFAVAAMLSMAFYTLYFARVNRGYEGPMARRIVPIFAIGTLPLALWAAIDLARGSAVTWTAVGLLAVLGIVIYVPAYLLQHRILLTAGPSYYALLGLATPPLVGFSSAVLHLAGVPTPVQIAGVALTVLGMVVILRRKAG